MTGRRAEQHSNSQGRFRFERDLRGNAAEKSGPSIGQIPLRVEYRTFISFLHSR